jgi:serine phosphatase RsbU (regulator of sigma subunit)/anti-sigma regulatory factor (Ser/Thr protein kinase)
VADGADFTARASFAPDPTAPSRARSFTRDALRAWGLPDEVVDDAVLLVSELVANGVQHAGTELEVHVRLAAGASPGVEVQVTDQHPARALPATATPAGNTDSERGRGLLLPSALASEWGVTYTAAAKTVWFRLPVPGREGLGAGDETARDGTASTGGAGAREVAGQDGDARRRKLPQRGLGNLDFDELVRRTVEAARDAVSADAAYALLADEDGELRVRATVGIAAPESLTAPPGLVVLSGGEARSQLSVPFLVDGRVTGVLGVGAADSEVFTDQDSRRLQGVADRVAMSLERLRLSEFERVRRGRVAFLAEASELLSSTLDQRQAIALTAQLMVPRLAAWCAVFVSEVAGELRPACVWHEDEARIDDLARLLGELTPPSLLRVMAGHGTSWSLAVVPGAGPEIARMASDSAWCFPLTARGRGLGMVVIGRPRGDRRWTDPPPRESLGLAEDLTRRAALALDNARLYERQQATSQALQHSLLPPELPVIPGVELAAEYEAAGEANDVGGDFYDIFPVDAAHASDGDETVNRWRFAIGDVCGTGPEAAAVTGLARNSLRILAAEGHDVAEVTGRLNRLILNEGTRGRFITLLHGEIRLDGPGEPARLSLVCAGHPPPLLLRADSSGDAPGSGEAADGQLALPFPAAGSQLLLGVTGDASFEADEISLYPGDVLIAVTDGVTERRDDHGRLLDDDGGLARMLATCRSLSATGVAARIGRAVSEFGSEPSADDMAILVLRAQLSQGMGAGPPSFPCRTDDLPAERGPDRRRGGAEVPGWFDEAPLVECRAVGDGAPVAEAGEVKRPDIHDRLEPVEFVVGRLDMPAVGADGSVDPLLVRPARVPRARAPDQVSEVGQARAAPGRLPVDRDWPLLAQNGVIGGVQEVSVEQALRKPVTVVGRAHLVAEPLEPFALGGRDLRIDSVEKRQGR